MSLLRGTTLGCGQHSKRCSRLPRKQSKTTTNGLQHYDKVVLFFDNDPAGRQALKMLQVSYHLAKSLHRLSRRLQGCLRGFTAGDAEAVRAVCNYNHQQYTPDGIVDAKDLLEVVTTPSPPADHDYPFQGLQTKLHGIRFGELTTITAGSGIGKSSFCRQSQLTFLIKENGSVTWHLKNLTAVLLSDSCHQQSESPSTLENTANET